MNPNGTPENLKPFKPGESGNPNGRPPIPGLKESIDKIMSEIKDKDTGTTGLDEILRALERKALKGNVRAAQLLFDRAYGKAKIEIEFSQKRDEISEAFPSVWVEAKTA